MTDATLKSLEVVGQTLEPTFEAGTTEYTVNVANEVEQITVNAVVNDTEGGATVSGDGAHMLSVGSNSIILTVTAGDAATTKQYTITVNRADAEPEEPVESEVRPMNVIHEFPGMYDKDMNTALYLLNKKEINEAKYNMVKEYLGVLGEGYQVLKAEDGKYYIKSAEDATVVEDRIKAELKAKGQTYPE